MCDGSDDLAIYDGFHMVDSDLVCLRILIKGSPCCNLVGLLMLEEWYCFHWTGDINLCGININESL